MYKWVTPKNFSFLFVFIYIAILFLTYIFTNVPSNESVTTLNNNVNWQTIFLHNIAVSFLIISLGIISISSVSLLIICFNFYLVFFSFSHLLQISGGNVLYSVLILSIHGSIEMITTGISFYISTLSLRKLINNISDKNLFIIENFKKNFYLLILVTFLLLLASIVESHLTPYLIQKIFK